jgi:hypothetical protein
LEPHEEGKLEELRVAFAPERVQAMAGGSTPDAVRDREEVLVVGRSREVGSSGRIRTENQPSTPADAEQLELDLKRT